MLSLKQRPCILGDKYAGKKKRDTEVRTLKLELKDIELSREEVNALLGEPHAYEALYDTSAHPIRPFLACIKALEIAASWTGARVVLWYELGATKVELKNATLSKIKITPPLGGDTRLSLSVEGEPVLDRKIAELIDRVGSGIECEIHAERPEDQQELPLNSHGEGEQPEMKSARKKARRGRGYRPGAH